MYFVKVTLNVGGKTEKKLANLQKKMQKSQISIS